MRALPRGLRLGSPSGAWERARKPTGSSAVKIRIWRLPFGASLDANGPLLRHSASTFSNTCASQAPLPHRPGARAGALSAEALVGFPPRLHLRTTVADPADLTDRTDLTGPTALPGPGRCRTGFFGARRNCRRLSPPVLWKRVLEPTLALEGQERPLYPSVTLLPSVTVGPQLWEIQTSTCQGILHFGSENFGGRI